MTWLTPVHNRTADHRKGSESAERFLFSSSKSELREVRVQGEWRVQVPCDICGKIFYKRSRDIRRRPKARHTCGNRCRAILMARLSPISSMKFEANPRFLGCTYENYQARGGAKDKKERARILARMAIRHGIVVLGPCGTCGSTEIEAHHLNYDEPLNVVSRCRPCHRLEHTDPDWMKEYLEVF